MSHHRGPDATGKIPPESLIDDDEGEILVKITAAGGQVVIAFRQPIDSIGFSPELARALAQALLIRAKECDRSAANVRRERKLENEF